MDTGREQGVFVRTPRGDPVGSRPPRVGRRPRRCRVRPAPAGVCRRRTVAATAGELNAPPDRITSPASTRCRWASPCCNSSPVARGAREEKRGGPNARGAHGEVCARRIAGGVGRRRPADSRRPRRMFAVERSETLLPESRSRPGCGPWPACSAGGEEGLEQGVVGRSPFQPEAGRRGRANGSSSGAGRAVLHPLEVGQAVRVVPAGPMPSSAGPALVVEGVSRAGKIHAVDAAGSTEHLAAGRDRSSGRPSPAPGSEVYRQS